MNTIKQSLVNNKLVRDRENNITKLIRKNFNFFFWRLQRMNFEISFYLRDKQRERSKYLRYVKNIAMSVSDLLVDIKY